MSTLPNIVYFSSAIKYSEYYLLHGDFLFEQIVSEQFLITFPSTRLGYSFYFHIYPQEHATLTLGVNLRPNEESYNNQSLEWNQTRAFLDFEYAVFENKRFRIVPPAS